MKTDKLKEEMRKLFEADVMPVLTVPEIAAKCKVANGIVAKFVKAYGLKRSIAWRWQSLERARIGREKALLTRAINLGNKDPADVFVPDVICEPPVEDFPAGTNFAAPGRHFHSKDKTDAEFYRDFVPMRG